MNQNRTKEKKIRWPRNIEDYELIKELGRGGFASVYLARCRAINIEIAIKQIDKSKIGVKRLYEEIFIHSELDHASIVKQYCHFEKGNYVYLVLELCVNGDLENYRRRCGGRLLEDEARNFLTQVLYGINYLHGKKIMHRDIKPANLLLDHDNHIKIADFGMAAKLHPTTSHTTMCGTPNFTGPEVASGGNQDTNVDIWSFGVLMYTLLIGRVPFPPSKDIGPKGILVKVVTEDVRIPENAGLSRYAEDLIMKCTNKLPEKRISIDKIIQHPFMQGVGVGGRKDMTFGSDSGIHTCTTHNTVSRIPSYGKINEDSEFAYAQDRQGEHVMPLTARIGPRDCRATQPQYMRGNLLKRCPDLLPTTTNLRKTAKDPVFPSNPNRIIEDEFPYSNRSDPTYKTSGHPNYSEDYDIEAGTSRTEPPNGRSRIDKSLSNSYNLKENMGSNQSVHSYRSYNELGKPNGHHRRSSSAEPVHKHHLRDESPHNIDNVYQMYGKDKRSVGLDNVSGSNERNCSSRSRSQSQHSINSSRQCDDVGSQNRYKSVEYFDGSNQNDCCSRLCYQNGSKGCYKSSFTEHPKENVHPSNFNQYNNDKFKIPYTRDNFVVKSNPKKHQLRESKIPEDITALSTTRLLPYRTKTKFFIFTLLDSGSVCIEKLRNKDTVVKVMEITKDGRYITIFRPGQGKGVRVLSEPLPCPKDGKGVTHYCFDKLPKSEWKTYKYGADFIKLIKEKTPKITYYSKQAKCNLMENSPPNFEASFYDGPTINLKVKDFPTDSGENMKTKVLTISGADYLMADCPECLPSELRNLYSHFVEAYNYCKDVESAHDVLEARNPEMSSFPVIVGPRRSNNNSNQKPNDKYSSPQSVQSFSTARNNNKQIGLGNSTEPALVTKNLDSKDVIISSRSNVPKLKTNYRNNYEKENISPTSAMSLKNKAYFNQESLHIVDLKKRFEDYTVEFIDGTKIIIPTGESRNGIKYVNQQGHATKINKETEIPLDVSEKIKRAGIEIERANFQNRNSRRTPSPSPSSHFNQHRHGYREGIG